MRATRAYIASAGTAAVLLGGALAMLVVVGAFVAFGSWPGEASGRQVDQVLLNEVTARTAAHKVAVRADAVKVARRAETRTRVALARARRVKRTDGRARTPAGNPVAQAPGTTVVPTGSASPVAAAPAPAGTSPANTVKQQTQDATQNLQQTTKDVGTQVQTQVDQTTTQVNQVVDQVVGGVQQQTETTVQQVQDTVGGATDTVTNTAGGLLGH